MLQLRPADTEGKGICVTESTCVPTDANVTVDKSKAVVVTASDWGPEPGGNEGEYIVVMRHLCESVALSTAFMCRRYSRYGTCNRLMTCKSKVVVVTEAGVNATLVCVQGKFSGCNSRWSNGQSCTIPKVKRVCSNRIYRIAKSDGYTGKNICGKRVIWPEVRSLSALNVCGKRIYLWRKFLCLSCIWSTVVTAFTSHPRGISAPASTGEIYVLLGNSTWLR